MGEKLDLTRLVEAEVPQVLKDLHLFISSQITELKACFKDDVRVAVVIRNTKQANANIIIGDATTEDINFVVNGNSKNADQVIIIPGNIGGYNDEK